MRIYITLTEEPLFITPFIKEVINDIHKEIIGVAIVNGTAFKTKNQNFLSYLLTLSIISNPYHLFKRFLILLCYRILNVTDFTRKKNPFSVRKTARRYGIPVININNVNSENFVNYLNKKKPDIIINQSQAILKKEFLSVPKIASLNRHGALLPKYRGRLAPFWAYLNDEKYTGVSIHFIERKLDSGPIVVQKKIKIERFDGLDRILKKIFAVAPRAMVEAIRKLEKSNYKKELIGNNDCEATYFSSPTIKDAIKYRKVMLKRFFTG